jgi:hypothetical protein
MNLTYDKSKVFWEFEGKQYEYCISNISSVSLEKNYIYIESIEYRYNRIYTATYTYLALNGLLIVSISTNFENLSKSIKMLDENNKEFNLEIKNLGPMCANDRYIYVIAGKGEKEKLTKFSLHGKIIKEYLPPLGCTFERFFNLIDDDKKIEVICNAKEYKEGTSWQWCFELDTETGQWQRKQSIDGH